MTTRLINGNILDCTADYLVHQCNCRTKRARGLAEQVFAKYPRANTYGSMRTPGTIEVIDRIVNFYAQDRPSKDSSEPRLNWFRKCLDLLSSWIAEHHIGIVTCAFPHNIGCGLAGGEWRLYRRAIEQFAADNIGKIHVIIYSLSPQE